jgi:putative MATE family efflux protein
MAVFYIFMKPILTAFGASDVTYYYASGYLKIYLIGTVFSMLATGLNPFINLQGFAKTGMATMLIGAVVNIVLDPIFIFWFNLGIFGAAVATVISQILSAVWVLRFLTGKTAILTIKREYMKITDFALVRKILGLGMSGFIMAVTNSLTQIACNSVLQKYGGDVYVGVMALLCSVREMTTMIISGLNSGAQPVIGYNYGAGEYKRVKQGIFFIGAVGITYTVLVWLLIDNRPDIFIRMFTSDAEIVKKGIPALKVYFQGFFMMSLQFCGQSAFVALGRSKNAIFFSLFRKALIVVPLVYLLPLKFGVEGVFYSEPISNYIGCTACFVTMIIVVRKMLSGESSKNE